MYLRAEAMVPRRPVVNYLFTVKVDVSAVFRDNGGHRFYLLLVDTRKTKMVYEFKLWIRFIFSLESLIELMFEDAVIHDLEDVQILSLLQVVRVVPVRSGSKGNFPKKDLLSKLKNRREIQGNGNRGETSGASGSRGETSGAGGSRGETSGAGGSRGETSGGNLVFPSTSRAGYKPRNSPANKPGSSSTNKSASETVSKPVDNLPDNAGGNARGNDKVGDSGNKNVFDNDDDDDSSEAPDDDDLMEFYRHLPGLDNQVGSSSGDESSYLGGFVADVYYPQDPNEDPKPSTSGLNLRRGAVDEMDYENDNENENRNENQNQAQNQSQNRFFSIIHVPPKKIEVVGQINAAGGSDKEKTNSAQPASTHSVSNIEPNLQSTQNKSDPINSQGDKNKNPRSDGKAPAGNKTAQNTPKKQLDKPFSMGQVLDYLRSEPSTSGYGNRDEVRDTEINNPRPGFSGRLHELHGLQGEGESSQNSETFPAGKSRKRVRKHKSRRKNFPGGSSQQPNPRESKESPENVRPKHIRFDGEYERDEMMSVNAERNTRGRVGGGLNNNRAETYDVNDLRVLIEEKKEALADAINNSNSQSQDTSVSDGIYNEDGYIYGYGYEDKNENGNERGNEKEKGNDKENENEKGKENDDADDDDEEEDEEEDEDDDDSYDDDDDDDDDEDENEDDNDNDNSQKRGRRSSNNRRNGSNHRRSYSNNRRTRRNGTPKILATLSRLRRRRGKPIVMKRMKT